MLEPADQPEDPPGTQEPPEHVVWREPPPPPEIPELLRQPARHPPPAQPREVGLAGMGKAWGVALDFVFTILAAAGLGWLGGRYLGHPAAWIMGGLAVGFAIALTRIVRGAVREDRESEGRKRGDRP